LGELGLPRLVHRGVEVYGGNGAFRDAVVVIVDRNTD
jgi:hypothetical protein